MEEGEGEGEEREGKNKERENGEDSRMVCNLIFDYFSRACWSQGPNCSTICCSSLGIAVESVCIEIGIQIDYRKYSY